MASHLALPFFTKQWEYREYDFNLFSVYYLLQLGGGIHIQGLRLTGSHAGKKNSSMTLGINSYCMKPVSHIDITVCTVVQAVV